MKKVIQIIVLLFVVTISQAQEKDIVFEQITNESGRSLGFITGIVQDNTGFMWFSTRNGLYRYNGYSYKLFKNRRSDSLSLPYNDIAYMYYDRNNNFWLRHYDELSVFKDEKRLFDFDSIINKNYDIEVKIVQDKRGNYWVGPTGKGLIKYNPETKKINNYSNPLNTYSQETWNKINTIIDSAKVLTEIAYPGNNTDTTVSFTITKKGYFLLASSGEVDKHGKYDFGALYKNGDLIWELTENKCMWSGGVSKNVFEVKPLKLEKGNYTITYKSDMSHSCGNWDGKQPDKTGFCGIKIVYLSEKEFEYFKNEKLKPYKDSTFIVSNLIKDLLIDNYGNFWALTDKGLEKYNYRKKSFDFYAIDFKSLLGVDIGGEYLNIYQDKQGEFWIGSMYGLIKYNYLLNKFIVFQNSNDKVVLTSNTIYSVFEDNNSMVWIGTDRGINIYNKEKNTIKKITANNHNRLYDNRIIKIYEDHSGNIWVATFEGLNRLIKTKFTFTDLKIDIDNSYPAIYDEAANIWYGVDNNINRYSRTLQNILSYKLSDKIFAKDDFSGKPDYEISDMVIDNRLNIWLATDDKVSRYNLFMHKMDFIKTAGAIIVGSDSIKNSVKQLIIKDPNTLYAFCPNGFYLINIKNLEVEKFFPFSFNIDFIGDFDRNFFKNAKIDQSGNIWIRTSDGFYEFISEKRELKFVYKFNNLVKTGPLSGGYFDIENDKIWFSTLPYLVNINAKTLDTVSYQINYDHDWGLANVKVGKNRIYIYGSNGLYIFDKKTKTFEYASVENGFVDNNINGIEEDKRQYLWMTTLKGLIKYDAKEKRARNFFTSADYTTHHFLGNSPGFVLPTGEKIFFTTKGFLSFFPDSINESIPKVVIDKFTIKGKEYKLDSLIYQKRIIHLKYNQNFIGFEFAVLDYTLPAENRYRYKLQGLDDDWIYTDANNRKASYSGIPPGDYTFIVQGSNNDKVWNTVGARIQVIITPPWYKTIVAYIAYIIIIISSIWIFIKVREKKLIEEKRILEQKVKERTAEIEAQKEELAKQNEMIAEQNKNITDSIHYAQRIQSAILPPVEQLSDVVDEFFILYRPRDIVSGDYYWATRKDDITIIVAADCTGHGVPGAFMSMLGIAFLNEIVNKEGIVKPNEILNRLRQQVVNQLHQGEEGESKDGMDVSLYVIDHKNMKVGFSGAYNPLYIIRDNEVIQLKADRMPIGYHIKIDTPFTMQEIDLQKGDCLYNSSDGYPDQFGGPDERKFMTKRFKQLLLDIHQKPMAEQKQILDKTIDEWRGDIEQIDDIIVIGVRI